MRKFLLFALCLMMLTGCAAQIEETTAATTKGATDPMMTTAAVEPTTAKKMETIKPSEVDITNMQVYKTATVDMTSGDKVEIAVYTNAEKDTDGKFMWDDGHEFMAIAKINEESFLLNKKEHVQMGALEFMAYENMENGDLHILVEKSQGAGIDIKEYILKKGGKEFSASTVYEMANINGITDSKTMK